jgi:hypothetical protein
MRSLVVLALAALAVAACNGKEATPTVDAPDERLVAVPVRHLYDMSRGRYIEGALSYVRVEDARGHTIVAKQLDEGDLLDDVTLVSTARLHIEPGTYRLITYQRPCSGNCTILDPPTDRCAREITLDAGRAVAVTITARPGERCTIELASR